MAFFKLRKGSDEQSAAPAPLESVEAMRRRAKYRLLGAAVLVLLGVIGFPLLFDKQPRPISVETRIEIPDKNKVTPLSIPASVALPPAPELPAAPLTAAANGSNQEPKVAPVEHATPAPAVVAKDEPKPLSPVPDPAPARASDKPDAKPVPKALPKAAEAAKAQALLDGKSADTKPAATDARFVVQVGAFADAARAREVRLKLERAGLKTYTHVAKTKDGDRIRVRVGPFGTKVEAGKVVDKIKKLDLPAAILTL